MDVRHAPAGDAAHANVLALTGHERGLPLALAWIYVALRVAHSLVQATWNRIETRFSLFMLGSLALVGMIAVAVRATLLA